MLKLDSRAVFEKSTPPVCRLCGVIVLLVARNGNSLQFYNTSSAPYINITIRTDVSTFNAPTATALAAAPSL